ncbi:MAG: hypothetical protein HY672_03000 [Chloroflexi bacterium]|nr:hypothetical protein [Chloroflexota bacterium]
MLVPLAVFWLNLTLGIKATPLNTMLLILGLSAALLAHLWDRVRLGHQERQ